MGINPKSKYLDSIRISSFTKLKLTNWAHDIDSDIRNFCYLLKYDVRISVEGDGRENIVARTHKHHLHHPVAWWLCRYTHISHSLIFFKPYQITHFILTKGFWCPKHSPHKNSILEVKEKLIPIEIFYIKKSRRLFIYYIKYSFMKWISDWSCLPYSIY